MNPTRETVMAETLRLHDLRYGNAHCERKWVEVCPKFVGLIFEAGDRLRAEAKS